MPITQIPFEDPVAPPPEKSQQLGLYDTDDWETAYRELDARVPHLLIQLEDDLQRSRKREAVWISIIFHLLIGITIWQFKFIASHLPWHSTVVVPLTSSQKDVTYLALPPDLQKVPHRPSNVISDKDRIATSRHPELDPKMLKKLLASPPPGAPGLRGPRTPQPEPPAAQAQPAPQQAPVQRPQPDTNAQFQVPTQPKPDNSFSKYAASRTPGEAIQQAARGAADAKQAGGGSSGDSGDFGLGRPGHGRQLGNAEILSDTMGVDFDPYIKRIVQDVRENWYHLIPVSAEMKKGKLAIEFAITKDGQVAGMRLVSSSGDVYLDRPAWGAITASNPFPPLPTEFQGQYLALRFRFFYNPDKSDLE